MISLPNPIGRLWPSTIRSRLIVGVAVVHLLLMTTFVFDLVMRQRDFLKEQSLEQTKSLAQTLAINSSSWILANDVVGLAEIVRAVAQYPDLRYAMVVDSNGKVLAHTDKSHIGQYLVDEKSQLLLAAEPKMQILYTERELLDIAAPIVAGNGKGIGWARIGLGQERIEDNLNVISKNGIFYTLLAIAAGSLFAVLLGKRLTAGLNQLLDVSRQIEKGGRDLRVEVSSHDEIALLGVGFNNMLDALAAKQKLLLLDQQRLESLANIFQFQAVNRQELFDYALEQALLLTGSEIGFICDYDPNKRELVLVSWSREVMKQCAIEGAQNCFQLDSIGLLGEAVRQRRPVLINDYPAENPLKKGCPQGHVLLNNFLAIPVLQQGQIVAVVGVANKEEEYNQGDIAQLTLLMDAVWRFVERKQAEQALEQALREWSSAMDAFDDVIYLLDLERRLVRANTAFYLVMKMTPEIAIGRRIDTIMHPQGNNNLCPICRAQEEQWDFQVIMEVGDPNNPAPGRPLEVTVKIIRDRQGQPTSIFTALHDLSVVRKEMDEKATLEKQLQQAQRMEAVGRLAGGVAHDFNNMLGVILGYTDMALTQVGAEQPLHAPLVEIRKAAQHSADLTRQLLAFARRQTVTPKVLELNEIVEGMLKMLQRLIGENIQLSWQPGANLWAVKMDPAQIDQILANLCVNARDSIAGVGTLSIVSENVVVDQAFCVTHPDAKPGEYVRLAVSDSGCGMEKEMLAHIFEPFFTTKDVGVGTGLGLATVDGIVHQNNGFIRVASAPGQGTAFTIYLPRHAEQHVEEKGMGGETRVAKQGRETVLLVEDESTLLQMTTIMLQELGYTVMAANTPDEALRLASEHNSEIQLLMTDVVMPKMSGRDLTERLLSLYPHLKSLFMSGYTADIISEQGILDEKVNFLQKPFSIKDMAEKVREALDRE
jgi:signal transduction histidine kinase/ActR/RegA family two-component response regulator